MRKIILKSFALLLGGLAIVYFLIYFPYTIGVSNEPLVNWNNNIFRYIAFVPAILGGLINGKCMLDFIIKGQGTPAPVDPPKKLVITGLYKWCRNPMYVGVMLILSGYLIWFLSLQLLLYTGGIYGALHLFIVLYEEPTLKQKFGKSYLEYCQQVPRWIPRTNLKKS
jgi:protein-S-isoprenylcysteine O-methyltransferase Ste14